MHFSDHSEPRRLPKSNMYCPLALDSGNFETEEMLMISPTGSRVISLENLNGLPPHLRMAQRRNLALNCSQLGRQSCKTIKKLTAETRRLYKCHKLTRQDVW